MDDYFVFDEERGTIRISESVIASIASKTCAEVDGVSALAGGVPGSDITDIFTKKSGTKGVRIQPDGTSACKVDVSAIIENNVSLTDTAKAIQQAVKTAIESMTGLSVTEVNVYIAGVAFQK